MKNHDKLSIRLAQILTKFNNGEKFTILELAQEFAVSARTIERDLKKFSYLPINKDGKYYFLQEYALGKLNFDDIKNFAIFSGIKSLYPSLTNQFLAEILNDKINRAFLVNNNGFEDIKDKTELFEKLSLAILEEKIINFTYNDKNRSANPYKLINTNGVWYLSATENGSLKTYTFSKFKNLKISDDRFIVDKEILKEIEKSEINFLSKDSKEVVLEVQNSAKEYFLRKKVLSNMKIIEENKDSFLVSTYISFDDEILNIVKYWIPYIRILKPVNLQEKLEDTLKNYLNSR